MIVVSGEGPVFVVCVKVGLVVINVSVIPVVLIVAADGHFTLSGLVGLLMMSAVVVVGLTGGRCSWSIVVGVCYGCLLWLLMLLLVVSSVAVVVVLLALSKKDLSQCRTSTTEQEAKPSYRALPKVMTVMRVINVFP